MALSVSKVSPQFRRRGARCAFPFNHNIHLMLLCYRTGTIPVTEQERADTQFNKVFFVWFSMNFNILSFVSREFPGIPVFTQLSQLLLRIAWSDRLRTWSP